MWFIHCFKGKGEEIKIRRVDPCVLSEYQNDFFLNEPPLLLKWIVSI